MRNRILQPLPTRKTERGAAIVELALIVVVMMLIVAGIIGFGRFFWYADALTKATRDAARLMSESPSASLAATSTEAKNLVVNAASASSLPAVVLANVVVECDNSSPAAPTYTFGACANNTTPANVRVRITGYSVNLTEWFPLVSSDGLLPIGTSSWSAIGLAPKTTMRYMR